MKKILVGILLLSLWLQPVLPFLEIAYAQNPSAFGTSPSKGEETKRDTRQDQQKTVKTIKPSSTSLFSDPIDFVKGYRKKVDQKNFKAYFKDKKSDSDYLSYRYGDNWLNLSPTFSKTFTVNYETSENQIKEKIVIERALASSAPTQNVAFTSKFTKNSDLKIKVEGKIWDEKTAVATSKRIEFIGKNNKILFYWEPVVYYDSAPEAESVAGRTQLNKSKDNKSFLVTLYVPTSWLTDNTRVYPIIIDPTFTDANSKTLDTQANWWNSAWVLNKQLTVVNNGTTGLSGGAVVTQTIDTKALVNAGNLQSDCDDLRITYGATTQTELTRALVYPTGLTCATSTATQVSFALQASVTSGSSDNHYYLYYKNGSTSSPSATQQAFNIGSTQATLVLPFNGTTTAVGTGVTPTTASGAIRYSTNSAMSFDGGDDYVNIGTPSLLNNLPTGDMTVSAWIKDSKKGAGFGTIFSGYDNKGWSLRTYTSSSNKYLLFQATFTQNATYQSVSYSIPVNTWTYVTATWNSANKTAKLFVNGQEVTYYTATAGSGTYTGDSTVDKMIGRLSLANSGQSFNGLIDELAIYNKSLSSAEITSLYNSGAGRVVQRDANTKLILHFDENGSDPRSVNTAFDDSGNGNNGTIYGGAKYVSGLVGVDPSTTLGVTQGSFASHQGVFIEEGTVNRVKNPSFESNVTDSWVAKPSINFTTAQTDSDGNALVGSNNIKDVFFYDTTKDSDGGAWRYNSTAQASSWYNEAFSTTRGKKKEFPEKAYIVSSTSYVDIIDAVENKLWMRFTGGTNNVLATSSLLSVTALNGTIYLGDSYASGRRLIRVRLITDSVEIHSTGNHYLYSGTIAERNSAKSQTSIDTTQVIINTIVNDVSVAVISGKTYVAVATDGGVSVINETDGTVTNIYTSAWTYNMSRNVFFAGSTLYASNTGSGNYPNDAVVYVFYNANTLSGTVNWSSGNYSYNGWASTPRLMMANAANISPKGLYVTSGTSTVDGTSNTIYIAFNGGAGDALTVLQEKQGDEAHGSVKYYDKNHITEEMVGAIKGQWGLWETTATEANQFKASGYLDTGKLGQAVSVYGNAAGTTGSTLAFNRGTQISGNNYEHINTNQGTISFWFKPSWNGDDGLNHVFYINRLDSSHYVDIYKTINNNQIGFALYDGTNNSFALNSSATISSGTWYHVIARWSVNKIDGTNYADIRVSNGTVATSTTAYTGFTPSTSSFIGSRYDAAYQANALIDDFAIFDRVLSTTEITSLYNSGTGNEAGYVADSSLKFYAKLDGSGTLQSVTYNGGASASKMTAASSELTGGTNIFPDGNMESVDMSNWVTDGSPTTLEKATTNIFADTKSAHVVASAVNQGFYKQITGLTSGGNYHVEFWYKIVSGGLKAIISGTTAGSTTYLWVDGATGWTKFSSDVKLSGTSLQINFRNNGTLANAEYYIDNVIATPNLVDNGGMEGQYTPTGSAKYHATTAQVRSGSGPYTYTETGKFATGLAGLIATDGADFGYITTSDANSITVDFTGGSGIIPTNAALDVVSAVAPGWTPSLGSGRISRDNSSIHSGSYATRITAGSSGQAVAYQNFTVIPGTTYLVSFWTRGDGSAYDGGYFVADNTHGGNIVNTRTGIKGTTYQRYSFTFIPPTGCVSAGLNLKDPGSNGTSAYFDDVSVTPLDNVSTSFNSWASVSDSSALGNSLSVQGSATGVQSLAAGVRNSAYTFDGSTGYLRQATIATNIGTLGYSGNTLADDGQTFTSYKTSTGNAAYMIVVTNSDNTTSWGYIGNNSEATTSVTVYTTIARTTQGWNGTAVSGKTPVGYEIRKTDFQITGNLTVGAWVKSTGGGAIGKFLGGITTGFSLDFLGISPSNSARFSTGDGPGTTGTSTVLDGNWHYVVGTFDSSTSIRSVYVDGQLQAQTNGASAPTDSYAPVLVGVRNNNGIVNFLNGSLDEPFVTAEALSAAQILDMYNKGLGALNHSNKADQKLQGSTNTVQAVAASSDGSTIYAGTDTALTVFKNGKSGNYTDSDSAITSFTTATTPSLVSNNTVALDLVGNSTSTTPSLIVGSSASGVSGINLVRGVPALDSSVYRFGSKALLLDNTNSVLDTPLVMQDTQTSAPYTLSFYAYSTGVTLSNADITPIGLNAPITTATYEDAGAGWTRVSATYNSDTGISRSYGLQVKAGKKIYIDGVQLEQKSYPTSYADGSMGTGYSWTTANNSVTTRAAESLTYTKKQGNISATNRYHQFLGQI